MLTGAHHISGMEGFAGRKGAADHAAEDVVPDVGRVGQGIRCGAGQVLGGEVFSTQQCAGAQVARQDQDCGRDDGLRLGLP